ncbi:polysaccharide deacetylase family protein [Aurantimonas sp. 22II-16-19i]|uniref:polysaccharide deacetylase family protein n=1 Tax=Aurantimonas sp. 22II-16-19i TaxID=1317114 RepID=UPI0009F7C8F7|nr:polysaccharide deacetylase family protein [Aurantimonas sp. 22II-16-19i]ORE92301.1 hypothetical protein ATO4_17307 [Aurantimonas sp. 22II-16-19i]
MSGGDFPLACKALDRLAGAGRKVTFWWRDDDARRVTPELERLLDLAGRHALPLAVAVIPEGAEPALAGRISTGRGVSVLLHGHAHANHAPTGEKRAEFGDHRPAEDMAGEITAGRAKLETLFGGQFRPVFVPPWNRIGPIARALLPGLGFEVVSVYGSPKPAAPGGPAEINTHLDVMDWRAMQGLTCEAADARLAQLLASRADSARGDAAGGGEPIGLLTHHLQHDEAAWSLTDRLLALLANHPAAAWPDLLPSVPAGEHLP